ncbi:proteasome activator complex subunit 3-like [Gigantopelta aegis]|uniref:proteasome activator complex subunit 3-like n=1 Tax=Gigantopelta aegis TaxID=1735272 RepID=UPI001B888F11|nr:proteasome activator complex subunit 3-like [Gigantopelta aegis]
MPKVKVCVQESDDTKKVAEFIEKCKRDAEGLVREVFPKKILELEAIHKELAEKDFCKLTCDLNIPIPEPIKDEEPDKKKRKVEHSAVNGEYVKGTAVIVFPNGLSPCNRSLRKLCDKMKPLIRGLIEHSNKIKMWISFLIPKIEDGNNFGVSIQEDTMAEARQVESEAATYLDQISRYYITRAKIVSRVAKYPHVEDYRQAVKELDEKEFVCLRLTCCELRNHYASLHDIIHKNMDKIKKPRNANSENLY